MLQITNPWGIRVKQTEMYELCGSCLMSEISLPQCSDIVPGGCGDVIIAQNVFCYCKNNICECVRLVQA